MAQTDPIALYWFRNDLRIEDHPGLCAAASAGRVIGAYVLDDETAEARKLGGAARWWLAQSLRALQSDLADLGIPLVLRRGRERDVIPDLAEEIGATAIFWARRFEPWGQAGDRDLKADFAAKGVAARSVNAALLVEPWEVKTQSGGDFKVYSPFYRAIAPLLPALAAQLDAPPPRQTPPPAPPSLSIDDLALEPSAPDWAGGLRRHWRPGGAGARQLLADFLAGPIRNYKEARNRPGEWTTSRLSPHLRFGEISPKRVLASTLATIAADPSLAADGEHFIKELCWREFSYHLLHHRPDLPVANWRAQFDAFPWRNDPAALRAWRRGKTGFPIIDAGMRELWTTGWMHNRVRMIVASFLIKDLMIDWRSGEEWFWDTLVDADLANNAASWQWVAGSGADAAPYFRIFNPVSQARKFDPDGAYVRRWVPELAALPHDLLHAPWEDEALARRCGIVLGRDYPRPMLDHGAARTRALEAFAQISAASVA